MCSHSDAEPDWRTVADVAAMFRVSRGFVYGMVKSGRWPALNLGDGERRGRVIRINVNDLPVEVVPVPRHGNDRRRIIA